MKSEEGGGEGGVGTYDSHMIEFERNSPSRIKEYILLSLYTPDLTDDCILPLQ